MIEDISQRTPVGKQRLRQKSKWLRSSWSSRAIIAVCLLFIFATSIVVWMKMHAKQQNMNDITVVKTRIGKLYLLPTNEQPALATVTNSKKLSSSFAGKVQNGDKILIYQDNSKAIVWRPSIDKIVDVEPVSIDTPPSQTRNSTP
jgi:hypothetical protein